MPSHPLDAIFSSLPLQLPELRFPAPLTVVVLAPHPDDFDAIGVSMRLLHQQEHEIHVAVLTAGANGIEDGWNGLHGVAEKAALRETEQQASCRFFGLPESRLEFLRMWEGDHRTAADDADDYARLRSYLLTKRPDLVFLPHGNDSNRTHRRTYETFNTIATQDNLALYACLNLDAKTVSMRPDLYMYFGKDEAEWKGMLLRFHHSQHERNLSSRGIGFDERVLKVNRDAAAQAGEKNLYAEVFELQRFG
jgi:LmbE family N-acetylglucosaminyl deacetylase